MVSGVSTTNIPTLSYIAPNYGKMSIPVDSSALIYSQFEHVSGIPAPEGTQGVSISKLNLLDTLISQLNQIKMASPTQSTASPIEGVDKLIENLGNQLREANVPSAAAPYYPAQAEGGVLFSLFS